MLPQLGAQLTQNEICAKLELQVSDLVEGNEKSTEDLIAILRYLNKHRISLVKSMHLLDFLVSFKLDKENINPKTKTYVAELFQKKDLQDVIKDHHLKIIIDNLELFEIMMLQAISLKPPYAVRPESRLVKELEFYQIREVDQVANVGAGSGSFTYILKVIYPTLDLSINELGIKKVSLLLKRMDELELTEVEVHEAGIDHSNFENKRFDKIILRNVFHHIEEKDKYLKDLKEHLTEDGYLLFNEPPRELGDNKKNCKQSMRSREIVGVISSQGFKLIDSKLVRDHLLLKFKKVVK